MKEQVIGKIEKSKIIAIVRGVPADRIVKLAQALYKGGIECIELTFDALEKTSAYETAGLIELLRRETGGEMAIGAGTVLTTENVRLAHDAGAEYIVSPDVNIEVIKETARLGMVSIPGAMTPTEIMTAHRAGADFVKLFPAGALGVKYMETVITPLSHIKILAVSGITLDNFKEFLDCGACGAGISGGLINEALKNNCDYNKITENARRFSEIAGNHKR